MPQQDVKAIAKRYIKRQHKDYLQQGERVTLDNFVTTNSKSVTKKAQIFMAGWNGFSFVECELTRKYFKLPTSNLLERFFSTAEYAYSDLPQNLLPQNLEMQLFLKINKSTGIMNSCPRLLLKTDVFSLQLIAINCYLILGCIKELIIDFYYSN